MRKSNFIYLGILTSISALVLLTLALLSNDSLIQLSLSIVLINILILINQVKVTTW